MLRKSRWGCQNQPLARIATSLEGLVGDVGISGHISFMFDANRELVFPTRLKGTKADEMNTCVKNMTRVRVLDNMANYSRTMEVIAVVVRLLLSTVLACYCFVETTHNTAWVEIKKNEEEKQSTSEAKASKVTWHCVPLIQ